MAVEYMSEQVTPNAHATKEVLLRRAADQRHASSHLATDAKTEWTRRRPVHSVLTRVAR